MTLNSLESWVAIDGIEFTGLCTSVVNDGTQTVPVYLQVKGPPYPPYTGGIAMTLKRNLYVHGWTLTTNSWNNSTAQPCGEMNGSVQEAMTLTVLDGSDSVPAACDAAYVPNILHWTDNMVQYQSQMVASACHDIHDNIFQHFYGNLGGMGQSLGHGNLLECNNMGNEGPAEVFYNNIIRHQDPSFATGGAVLFATCMNTTPVYLFNNVMYDSGGAWEFYGPPTYLGCPQTGRQWAFNNTFVGMNMPCYQTYNQGGQYLTIYNNHIINSAGNYWDSSGPQPCNGGPASATNVTMTDATALSQGYTTNTGMTDGRSVSSCANESTRPCSPISGTNSTVGAGNNLTSTYCNAIATASGGADTSPAINTDAATACKYATTDACSYVTATHSMSCSAQPVARLTAWDSGAYQSASSQAQIPQAPTNLQVTVQ